MSIRNCSSRIIDWVKHPSLPFDKTYTEFVTVLKWTDPEKLAHLRVAIAMCVGHPRSLTFLYDVITSHPDEPKVWIWINHLVTVMTDGYLGDMPLNNLTCVLFGCKYYEPICWRM